MRQLKMSFSVGLFLLTLKERWTTSSERDKKTGEYI